MRVLACLLLLNATVPALAAGEPSPETSPRNQVVGLLPYSNQWVYEKRQSILYIALHRGSLASETFRVNSYDSVFSSSSFDYPSIDYFVKLFGLGSPEGRSPLRGFALWSRYSLGVGWRQGKLVSDQFGVSTDSEHAYLVAGVSRAGAMLAFDSLAWIQPYAGMEISPFLYRHSASLSGAEAQGGGALFGPVAGVHLPLFLENRASVFGEVRRSLVLSDGRNIFGASTNVAAGVGMVF